MNFKHYKTAISLLETLSEAFKFFLKFNLHFLSLSFMMIFKEQYIYNNELRLQITRTVEKLENIPKS